ncbi:MAG: hypothetical protein V7K71_24180 [Nostoc sp.]|uniref:hypothetical protein n=1 Tax=Nostoc sp. TaxID=1180 RepID=UPI002FF6CDBB
MLLRFSFRFRTFVDVCQENDTVSEILLIPILYEDAPRVQEEGTAIAQRLVREERQVRLRVGKASRREASRREELRDLAQLHKETV